MSTYPYSFLVGIVIECFYVTVRYTVAFLLGVTPFEFAYAAVKMVRAAVFGSYPWAAVFILDGTPYDRAAQSLLFVGRIRVAGIDLIFRIEVVDTAKVSSQPERALIISYNAPDGRACKAVALYTVGGMVLEQTSASVAMVQSVKDACPYISRTVLVTGPDEIRRKAVQISDIVLEVFNLSVCPCMEQSPSPVANP